MVSNRCFICVQPINLLYRSRGKNHIIYSTRDLISGNEFFIQSSLGSNLAKLVAEQVSNNIFISVRFYQFQYKNWGYSSLTSERIYNDVRIASATKTKILRMECPELFI